MPKQHGGFQTGLGAPGALGEFHVQIASMRELGSCVHIKIGKIGEIGGRCPCDKIGEQRARLVGFGF